MTALILMPEISPIIPPVPTAFVMGNPGVSGPAFNFTEPFDVVTDAVGNIYITGRTYTVTGFEDMYVAKVNSDGTLAWDASLSDGVSSIGSGVAVDSNGNVFVAGRTYVTATSRNHFLLVKYNSAGVLQWQKEWRCNSGGTARQNSLTGIKIDSSDNLYLAGTSQPDEGSGPLGANHLYYAKMNNDATTVFHEFVTGEQIPTTQNVSGGRLVFDGSGKVNFIGQETVTTGEFQIFVQQNNAEPPTGPFFYNWQHQMGDSTGTDPYGDLMVNAADTFLFTIGSTPNLGPASGGSMVVSHHPLASGDPGIGGLQRFVYPSAGATGGTRGNALAYDGTDLWLGGYSGATSAQNQIFVEYNQTTGVPNWVRSFGGTAEEIMYAMVNDGFSNLVAAGRTRSLNPPDGEVLITRVPDDGSIPAGGPWSGYSYTNVDISWTSAASGGANWSSNVPAHTTVDASTFTQPFTAPATPAVPLTPGVPGLTLTTLF